MRGALLRDCISGFGILASCAAPPALAARDAPSRQPLAVSAHVLTACGMTTNVGAPGGVRVRCTGDVALGAGPTSGVSLSRERRASATIFRAQLAPSGKAGPRVVTLLF